MLKRLTDLVLSVTSLVVLSPLMFYIAIRVLLSSRGPVLYSQQRVGYKGREFLIRKFRSMYHDAEKDGPQLSNAEDSRITPWGRVMRRWKLDELPQLWNVLAGDMSIVGPRPERAYYIDQIGRLSPSYHLLLQVKPGLTSLGMVKFGYATSVGDMVRRMRYDLLYLDHISFRTDLRIILATLRIIFRPHGR